MRAPRIAIACVLLTGPVLGSPPASLSGSVTSAGKPLANATVFVSRAWPIEGVAYYCPSCYLDCAKSATTDGAGRWTITGLDDTLKFELLVAAPGHVPKVTSVVVPFEHPTIAVDLTVRDVSSLPASQVVAGRVLGPDNRPVVAAIVSPEMVYTPDGGGRGGAVEGLDDLAVTDVDGRFALAYDKPCVSMDLKVTARALAPRCFQRRVSQGTVHELRLTEGGSVVGRLMHNGRPLPDVEITLVLAQRTVGLGCFERGTIATGQDGRFLFANVLPQGKYVVSASGEQLRGMGCAIPKVIDVREEHAEVQAGDLEVIKGLRVAGRILPPADGRIPDGAKLSLSAELAWETITIDLPPDGEFEYAHVPPGEYRLRLHAPGLYLSMRNVSADRLNQNFLSGNVDLDITDLVIETTGTRPENGLASREPARPGRLRGVESLPSR